MVGKDPDLIAFCASRDDLIQLDSVAELLSLALTSADLLARLEAHVRGDTGLLRALRARLGGYRARHPGIDVQDIEFRHLAVDSVLLVGESEGDEEFALEVGVVAEIAVEVSEVGHEFVISSRGEPDIEMVMHRSRPRSDAVFHLEVVVTAMPGGGAPVFETTDWYIVSGEVEIELPSSFSQRTVSLEPA